MQLPTEFEERMRNMLGDEYDAFRRALTEGKASKAVFLNPQEREEAFLSDFPFSSEKLGFCDNGYLIESELPGKSLLHHAGAFYVQDPSAMATVCALDIKEGSKILDVCAAPGGKSIQMAFRTGESGLLISNEIDKKRVKILKSNVERMGLTNTVVTSCPSGRLGELYRAYFDIVLVDAPCSGEGMFRKYEAALDSWNTGNVRACAERQHEILTNIRDTVADGGYLLYSTCTFSEEENELQVSRFLSENPDYTLVSVNGALLPYTSEGNRGMALCRRFYPHIATGEGQFIALMQRRTDLSAEILFKDGYKKPTEKEEKIARDFLRENTVLAPDKIYAFPDGMRIISHDTPVPPGTFSYGVNIGTVEKGRFIPHHQLFSAYGHTFKRKIVLSADSKEAAEYISGQTVRCDCENGWCAVMIGDLPVGGGKVVDGICKNHYPKGLRMG